MGKTGSCPGRQGCAPDRFVPVSCLTWGRPALGFSHLYGRVNGDLQENLSQGAPIQDCFCQCSCLHGDPLLTHMTHTSTGDPLTLAGRSGSVSCGVTAPFPWVLVHARFCLCPPRVVSLFSPVLWKSWNQIPLALKVRFPRDSQFFGIFSLCHVASIIELC